MQKCFRTELKVDSIFSALLDESANSSELPLVSSRRHFPQNAHPKLLHLVEPLLEQLLGLVIGMDFIRI